MFNLKGLCSHNCFETNRSIKVQSSKEKNYKKMNLNKNLILMKNLE